MMYIGFTAPALFATADAAALIPAEHNGTGCLPCGRVVGANGDRALRAGMDR